MKMAVNKCTLRALVVLELIGSDEEKKKKVMDEKRQGIGSKKEKNWAIVQTLCKNYEWRSQMG